MALLDVTPIFLAVGVLFSLILIMLKEWYYEDMGLFFLGIMFYHIALLDKTFMPFMYLGWLFLMLSMVLFIINLIMVLSTLLGKPITIDIFHKKR